MKRLGCAMVWLFLLGAILGTSMDAYHVFSHVERYPDPFVLGVAWWVPLLFGGAALAIGYSHPRVDPLLGQRRSPRRLLWSLSEVLWLILAYLVTATALNSVAKVGLVAIIYLNFWLLTGRGWQNLLLSFVTAITGSLIEMLLVIAGAFSYLHPDLLGIPYWLPCLYACASLAVGDVGRTLIISPTRGTA